MACRLLVRWGQENGGPMTNSGTLPENVSAEVDDKLPSLTLALFYAIGLTLYLDWFIIGALLTPIKNELNLPDEQLALIGVVFFVASSFTTPVFGYVGDRFPRKPVMLVALAVWNIAAIASG